ncbi:hypothetical protein [Streptomyces sp. NBC_00102]|uniref:hypothetical protein n=1 Tax=Streptomyces sp. NBC_00102 TaxID=2975652 RepID=UPI002252099B|nr:hypothetical protein [Streptomyces sp. NBC_00102]MCX5396263.1 hypothetical protein [Streptomyces sp. NBC_00102]
MIQEAGHEGPGCGTCQDFDLAEEEAESRGDPSGAVDWRVLRRRHQQAEHPGGEDG